MNIQTLIAKIKNLIPFLSTNFDKLSRLKVAAQADYAIVVSKAEHALADAKAEVTTMATSELAALKAGAEGLAARAKALADAEVLKVEHVVEASVLAKIDALVQAEMTKVTTPVVAVDLTKTA